MGRLYKDSALTTLRNALIPLLFTAVVIAIIMIGLNETEQSARANGKRILEEGLWRAAVTCYAIEGSYPANLAHMEETYGVIIDKSRYAVMYEVIAPNIVPSITVLELANGGM